MRDVTLVPSRPAIGESLTAKRIDKVGGSIGCAWSGSVTAGSAIVLATVAVVRPAIEMMSPACASSTGTRSSPRNAMIFDARPVSTTLPSLSSAWIGMLVLTVPLATQAGQDAAEEIVAVEQGDQELERAVRIGRRRRHVIDDLPGTAG